MNRCPQPSRKRLEIEVTVNVRIPGRYTKWWIRTRWTIYLPQRAMVPPGREDVSRSFMKITEWLFSMENISR